MDQSVFRFRFGYEGLIHVPKGRLSAEEVLRAFCVRFHMGFSVPLGTKLASLPRSKRVGNIHNQDVRSSIYYSDDQHSITVVFSHSPAHNFGDVPNCVLCRT